MRARFGACAGLSAGTPSEAPDRDVKPASNVV